MRIVPATFGDWTEDDLKQLCVTEFRMHEVVYFYEMFRVACGQEPYRLQVQPQECQFLWISYADSFLSMLVSVEELVDRKTKQSLLASNLYRFVKQLRNTTIHRTVLGARRHAKGAAPIVSRVFSLNVGGSDPDYTDPKVNFERMRRQLSSDMKKGRHTQHVNGSRQFLRAWKRQGHKYVVLREVFELAIETVGDKCGIRMVEPKVSGKCNERSEDELSLKKKSKEPVRYPLGFCTRTTLYLHS